MKYEKEEKSEPSTIRHDMKPPKTLYSAIRNPKSAISSRYVPSSSVSIRVIRGCVLVCLLAALTIPLISQPAPDRPMLLLRLDDMGMCHDVNKAVERVIESGLPISTSVMFACPWYQEAVEILKKHPEVSVGVHLTLNAEWKNYKWGPVLGRTAVPSLVDSNGYFLPTRAMLMANNPTLADIEKELRAQIERALGSGLKIDYIDHHMSAAVNTQDWRALVEKLSRDYKLAVPQYFGEDYSNATYHPQIGSKVDSLVARVGNLRPGIINLQVVHVGLDNPEMAALVDVNETGPKMMSKQREDEMNSLLDQRFRDALKEMNVRLVTYRDVVGMMGLEGMKRPERAQ